MTPAQTPSQTILERLAPASGDFRSLIRTWIRDHAEPALVGLSDYDLEIVVRTGGDRDVVAAFERYDAAAQASGLVCAQWPREFGGRGLDALHMAVMAEELALANLPFPTRGMGELLVGPAVIAHGTPAQRQHFLSRIVAGLDWYCQGFSEPEAGSDLAAVATRGSVDGDSIVIDGAKIWTSHAHLSNTVLMLVRTEPGSSRHSGLSMILVPMVDNGIEVRELRTMSGDSAFSELHIAGARAPLFNVIGGLGNGWAVAMTALGSERGSQAATQHLALSAELDALERLARDRGHLSDPKISADLVWARSSVELIRMRGVRALARLAADAGEDETAPASKIVWSEYHRRLGEIAMDILGSDGLVRPGSVSDYEVNRWQRLFLDSRAETIYAGTSQIQRKIIAERILDLPRASTHGR